MEPKVIVSASEMVLSANQTGTGRVRIPQVGSISEAQGHLALGFTQRVVLHQPLPVGDSMKKYPSFVFRTIQNGQVRFDGLYWAPVEPTNRLDGKRFAFGVYVEDRHSNPVRRLDVLCLWGTKKAYKMSKDASEEEIDQHWDEDCAVLASDGYFRQYWWHPVPHRPCHKKGRQ